MGKSVLLLNASYEPMRVISWKRAICLFFAGKAEVIEEYEHQIRSVSLVIQAPAVIRLLSYVKIAQRTPALSRVNVLARDNFKCQYCAVALNSKTATIDHVVPSSAGGASSWTNMVCACASCNRRKGCKTLAQANMKLKTQPVKPDWLPVIRFKLNGNVPDTWIYFLQSFKLN